MPISVHWANDEKNILYYCISDSWTLEDAISTLENETAQMLDSISCVPDCIMDLQHSRNIPSGFLSYWRRTYDWMQAHQVETSFFSIIQAPPVLRGIGDTLRTLRIPIMRYVVFVDTVDEAYRKIEEHRAITPRIALDD